MQDINLKTAVEPQDLSIATNVFLAYLKEQNLSVPAKQMAVFKTFLERGNNQKDLESLLQKCDSLMAKWKVEERIAAIQQQPVRVLNATVGKPYETRFVFEEFGWTDIKQFQWKGLEEAGLHYDQKTAQLTGVPAQSGDIKLLFCFKIEGQPTEAPFNEKKITLIINPDPKSLWKNIPSDRNDPYWKEDDVTLFAPINDRHILVSSKRGRSHANVGSFREDDFAFKDLAEGWSIVVVSDGAGSARLSRQGSVIACNGIVDYFMQPSVVENMKEFDALLEQHLESKTDESQQKIAHFIYNNLGKAAFGVHKKLEAFAAQESVGLKDLSSTLIFTLFKKYEAGYALLSFGVGDCPMALLNKDVSEVTLLNWIDVGEFGGGTRFITMPEIFSNEKFATRFGFKLAHDFSYLMLMSDGIYDPKFVVEAALPDIKNWRLFLEDLEGKNEDGAKVELSVSNNEITEQFSKWMDFWSPGNHDDRTLAIVF